MTPYQPLPGFVRARRWAYASPRGKSGWSAAAMATDAIRMADMGRSSSGWEVRPVSDGMSDAQGHPLGWLRFAGGGADPHDLVAFASRPQHFADGASGAALHVAEQLVRVPLRHHHGE